MTAHLHTVPFCSSVPCGLQHLALLPGVHSPCITAQQVRNKQGNAGDFNEQSGQVEQAMRVISNFVYCPALHCDPIAHYHTPSQALLFMHVQARLSQCMLLLQLTVHRPGLLNNA